MNRNELFKRTEAILKPEIARSEVWAFIGVGSGGARVAEEAARFGVGTIILVDRPEEKLEEHNVIRHVLGYRDLGRLKTEALRDHLLNINPECNVEATSLDVVQDRRELAGIMRRSTQVHLCTDNERSKHVVNEEAVKAGVTLIFAGVFDGGCGGEVGRVTRDGACYSCMATYLNRSGKFDAQQAPETFDYTNLDSQEKSTAALNLDIAQITLIQARVGLLTMQGHHDKAADFTGNYVLFGNRAVEGLFPRMLSSDIWEIPRDAGCLVCGSAGMPDEDADAMAEAILASAQCHND
jgi:molybdopterin/thiamine biosynthesis adenylyltransferase